MADKPIAEWRLTQRDEISGRYRNEDDMRFEERY